MVQKICVDIVDNCVIYNINSNQTIRFVNVVLNYYLYDKNKVFTNI